MGWMSHSGVATKERISGHGFETGDDWRSYHDRGARKHSGSGWCGRSRSLRDTNDDCTHGKCILAHRSNCVGQTVRATAKLIEIDGRRLVFKVEAYDEQQKIGEGQHERTIVHLDRFLSRIKA